MRRIWRLLSPDVVFPSEIIVYSEILPGVRYYFKRVSQSLRLDFLKKVRDLVRETEFHTAGDNLLDKTEAAIAQSEIDRLYVETALLRIDGLFIGRRRAQPADLFENAPSEVFQEALNLARSQFGLSEKERKN